MYKLVVVELKDVVPRRDPDKPNLYVGYVDTEAKSLEEVVASAPDWVKGNETELRPDLTRGTVFISRKGVKNARLKLATKLSNKGYTVNQNTTVYRMYVIELNPEGTSDVGRGYLYVGETSIPIEERFIQHKTNARTASGRSLASRVVRKKGLRLRHDLIPSGLYFSRKASREAEARLAERLRQKGYRVEGGH